MAPNGQRWSSPVEGGELPGVAPMWHDGPCPAPQDNPRTRKPPLTRAVSRGRDRRRSGDLALFRRALYQLSYPTAVLTGFEPATSALTGRRALQTALQDLV